MKLTFFIFSFLVISDLSFGQDINKRYYQLISIADSLYKSKDYIGSANKYSEAFKVFDWKGFPNDRYNAACSWALANGIDSAFFQLEIIATKSNYKSLSHISNDSDFANLHQDIRWKAIIEQVTKNKEKAEEKYNKPLVAKLEFIYEEDQKYRHQIEETGQKYGTESKEMEELWNLINLKDSLNLIVVSNVLDEFGWLGSDIIGSQGSNTLFLVIQHSDINVQEKYLPMMREAVKNGAAQASSLALLEDRVALRQGKKQIYGSQIGQDVQTKIFYVSPLEDPDNVDKRRSDVGLGTLAEYVNFWGLVWDLEQYKKDLPELEKKTKLK